MSIQDTDSEFKSLFSTEKKCRSYLYEMKWPNGNFRCPECGNRKKWASKDGSIRCSKCTYKTSLTAGTIFEKTRKPLVEWFKVIWWIVNQKTRINAKELQRSFNLGSYETAWTWLHKIRKAMVLPQEDILSGIVDLTAVLFDSIPGISGYPENAQFIISAELNRIGRIGSTRLIIVTNQSPTQVAKMLPEFISINSRVRTDESLIFSELATAGYNHQLIADPQETEQINNCQKVLALFKEWIGPNLSGSISFNQLSYYLDEFTFRFNNRDTHDPMMLFDKLLYRSFITKVATYKDIVGSNPKQPMSQR